jgi:hypothetical protein
MIQPTLLFGALLSILSAVIYSYVGRVLSRRHSASPDSNLAWRLFVLWWYALAGTTLSGAALNLLGGFGVTNLPLFVTVTMMNLMAICVALFGLLYYLLYLFSGSRRWFTPLVVFYVIYYALLVYFVEASEPARVAVEPWRVRLVYQQQLGNPFFVIILLLLLFPQIIGGLVYFTLYFRVKTATQKYRILLVSWSIVIWFLSSFLASISGLSQSDAWQVLSRFIALAASLTIMFAYQPPESIKRRFGVTSIAEEKNQSLAVE